MKLQTNREFILDRFYLETPSGRILRYPSREDVIDKLKQEDKNLKIVEAPQSEYHFIIRADQTGYLQKILDKEKVLVPFRIRVIRDGKSRNVINLRRNHESRKNCICRTRCRPSH